ncbi:MAG: leucine-rich repeat protein [Lachnospiraceae bacterium]|nr:leucine-rich repeat protein [Lachnospiraceae bacterium]
MKLGTKIGLVLVALGMVLGVWVFAGGKSSADNTISEDGVLTIADGEEKIGSGAYRNNTNIKSVNIPASVKTIGSGAFAGATNLTTVTIADGSSLTTIESSAFDQDGQLTKVSGIPDSVSSIGANAFRSTSLSSFHIPSSLGSGLDLSAFDGSGITTFTGSSASYKSGSDGNLYNASGTVLDIVAPGTTGSVEIPSGTSGIASSAFRSNSKVTSITLPDGLTSIGTNAFAGTNVTRITIPASVTSINDQGSWNTTVKEILGYGADSAAAQYVTRVNAAQGTRIIFTDLSDDEPGTNPEDKPDTYTVSFDVNGGSGNFPDAKVNAGGLVNHPGYPTKDGYTFLGWFDDANGAKSPFDFAGTAINADLKLVAHWEAKKTDNGNTNNGNTSSGSGSGSGGQNVDGTTNPDGSVNHADGTISYPDGTIKQGNKTIGNTNAPASSAKDVTPTTAGPIDARYFLCLAILLAGIAVLLYSHSRKLSYVSKNSKRK